MLDPKETEVTTLYLRPEFAPDKTFLPEGDHGAPEGNGKDSIGQLLDQSTLLNSSNFLVPTPLFNVSVLQKQQAVVGAAHEAERTLPFEESKILNLTSIDAHHSQEFADKMLPAYLSEQPSGKHHKGNYNHMVDEDTEVSIAQSLQTDQPALKNTCWNDHFSDYHSKVPPDSERGLMETDLIAKR